MPALELLSLVLPKIRHPELQPIPMKLEFAVLPEIVHPDPSQEIPSAPSEASPAFAVLPEITHPNRLHKMPQLTFEFAVLPEITLAFPVPMPTLSALACTFLTIPLFPVSTPNPPKKSAMPPFSTVSAPLSNPLIPLPLVETLGPVIENPFKSIVTWATFTSIASALFETVRLPVRR